MTYLQFIVKKYNKPNKLGGNSNGSYDINTNRTSYWGGFNP